MIYSIRKFNTILRHQHFTVFTDNKTVQHWRTMRDECATYQWWFLYLAKFVFSVVFWPGRLNTNADALSRLPQPDNSQPEELLMQLGNPPNNEHLARFGVNLLWGEDWWDEIYREPDRHRLSSDGLIGLRHQRVVQWEGCPPTRTPPP